jgi:hypothetical protein
MAIGQGNSYPAGFPNGSSSGGGGGAASQVPLSTPGSVSENNLQTGNKGAVQITLYYLDIPYAISFDTIEMYVVASDDGTALSSCGIYDPTTKKLVAHFGPLTGVVAATNFVTDFPVAEGAVTLQPGRYIFATTCDTGLGFAIQIYSTTEIGEFFATSDTALAAVLPATLTVLASSIKGTSYGSNDAPANPYPGNTFSPHVRLFHS